MTDFSNSPKAAPHLRAVITEQSSSYEIKVSGWINHCQELAVNQADLLCKVLIEKTQLALEDEITKATTDQFGTEAISNLERFKSAASDVKLYFGDQINDGFDHFRNNTLATYIKEEDSTDNGKLSLVENSLLEETIAIKTISHDTHVEFSEALWKLDKRFSTMNNSVFVSEHNNPLSPLQFCISLRDALRRTNLNLQTRLTVYKVFAGLIFTYLTPLYDTTNEYFSSEGILPNLSFSDGLTPNHYNAEQTIDENPYLAASEAGEGKITDSQQALVTSIREMMRARKQVEDTPEKPVPLSSISNKNYDPEGKFSASPPTLFINQQIVDAVDTVQSLQTNLVDFSGASLTRQQVRQTNSLVADELAKKSPTGEVDPHDMYTIDLVGILFEYILTDENLPDSIKALLSHLHTPFLKLAFIDTRFFEKPEHPARLLLDSLAEAGTNWVNSDNSTQYDMYNEIKAVVTKVMQEFKNDVRLFADVLFEFNRLKNKLTHRHQLKERNQVEKVQGEERLRQAKIRAKQEIEARSKGIRLPSAVVNLLKPWYSYLTLLQLRDTDNEALWRQALRVVDELCYFFNFNDDSHDRSELEARFKGILTAAKIGFNTLGLAPLKTKKILVDITALKIATVKKFGSADNAPRKALAVPIRSVEPLKPKEEIPTEEEARVINYLKLIEPGSWFEFEQQRRFKVTGFSSRIMKYMLVDSSSQNVLMVSRLDLARKIIKGEAKVVAGSTKPLFERALERIFHSLESEAQSI